MKYLAKCKWNTNSCHKALKHMNRKTIMILINASALLQHEDMSLVYMVSHHCVINYNAWGAVILLFLPYLRSLILTSCCDYKKH